MYLFQASFGISRAIFVIDFVFSFMSFKILNLHSIFIFSRVLKTDKIERAIQRGNLGFFHFSE